MEEETLEKAAREYWKRGQFGLEKAADTERAFLFGGLWMAERMYSQEEVVDLIEDWTKMAKGINHHKSKLTEEQVLEIRKSNLSQTELALKYNVKQPLISSIINKRKWKHL
jgi:predicted XRE-type DNA-binding protein